MELEVLLPRESMFEKENFSFVLPYDGDILAEPDVGDEEDKFLVAFADDPSCDDFLRKMLSDGIVEEEEEEGEIAV